MTGHGSGCRIDRGRRLGTRPPYASMGLAVTPEPRDPRGRNRGSRRGHDTYRRWQWLDGGRAVLRRERAVRVRSVGPCLPVQFLPRRSRARRRGHGTRRGFPHRGRAGGAGSGGPRAGSLGAPAHVCDRSRCRRRRPPLGCVRRDVGSDLRGSGRRGSRRRRLAGRDGAGADARGGGSRASARVLVERGASDRVRRRVDRPLRSGSGLAVGRAGRKRPPGPAVDARHGRPGHAPRRGRPSSESLSRGTPKTPRDRSALGVGAASSRCSCRGGSSCWSGWSSCG